MLSSSGAALSNEINHDLDALLEVAQSREIEDPSAEPPPPPSPTLPPGSWALSPRSALSSPPPPPAWSGPAPPIPLPPTSSFLATEFGAPPPPLSTEKFHLLGTEWQWACTGPPPQPPPTPQELWEVTRKSKYIRKGSFNFLTLPREIRDEIYNCVLSRDPPPIITRTPGRPPRVYPPTYKQISLNLSLFRVSKQVHREATEWFYGQNTFVIRLSTDMYKQKVTVKYNAPWESVTYSYTYDSSLSAPVIESEFCGRYDSKPDVLDTQGLGISRKYWHMFRNIRIEIEDFRENRYFILAHDPRSLRPQQKTTQAILLPLLYRLQPLLDTAGKNLKVYIHVVSSMLSNLVGLNAGPGFHGATAAMVAAGATYTSFELLLRTFYEDMLRTVWPFTTGAWQYSITMPSILDVWTDEMEKAVLRQCDQGSGLNERELKGFEDFKEGKISHRNYCWVKRRGRLLVLHRFLYNFRFSITGPGSIRG